MKCNYILFLSWNAKVNYIQRGRGEGITFMSATDIVLELRKVASNILLHNYQIYSNINSVNKVRRKSALLNENPIRSQTSNEECNFEYIIIE